MSDRPVIYCHIKRPPADERRSEALDATLCGREDPGTLYYDALERDEQIGDYGPYPVCPSCAAKHIDEHYKAVNA